ncbi:universal stress protein [Alloscardovia theropitheci]|uniref:Universal stress protein n=1 Tax=Alloscardovia theropitheci TaxID=2496842 RepID=A0A4V2MTW5_9BIFI|nr:universal stress protein [Alloscardovia theropitheci]TCD54069.1 universal stress protein [Alloscardovia theropitheci]
MARYEKAILVGVDGSEAAYKAVWWAANYAHHAGLTLHIVSAYTLPSYAAVSFDNTFTASGDDAASRLDAQEILGRAKAIATRQGVEATTLIVTGEPSAVFIELSRNYNLVVIGNRGKGGLAERLLGTTSSSLPAYAYCPIVVVPYTDDDGNKVHLNNEITHVVVNSDESKWGLKALEIAAEFADSWGAQLKVISAVPPLSNLDDTEMRSVLESYADDLHTRLAPLRVKYPSLVIDEQVAVGTSVHALEAALPENDIVVVGSRGRGGLTGLLFGSVSQALLQHSDKPVYVVPRRYVQAAESELNTIPDSPDEVATKPLSDITGVESITVEQAEPSELKNLEETIDPS